MLECFTRFGGAAWTPALKELSTALRTSRSRTPERPRRAAVGTCRLRAKRRGRVSGTIAGAAAKMTGYRAVVRTTPAAACIAMPEEEVAELRPGLLPRRRSCGVSWAGLASSCPPDASAFTTDQAIHCGGSRRSFINFSFKSYAGSSGYVRSTTWA
jgi:hypothetical protein